MCGECCRHIDKIPQLSQYDIGNGTCRYLENNRCLIYENRPEICRIDKMYAKYYSDKLTLKEFYDLNVKACNILKHK